MGILDDVTAAIGGGSSLWSGLLGGGMQMAANAQANEYKQQAAAQQQYWTQQNQAQAAAYNMAAAQQAQGFNAAQAQIGRDFSSQQMAQAETYNAAQADIGRSFSAGQQLQAESFDASQAELNRQFQERMSSTAYQRATADMRAAGINPMVAYMQGGASTPSGSSAGVGAAGGPSASVSALGGPSASGPAASISGMPGARPSDRAGYLEGVVNSARTASRLEPEITNLRAETSQRQSDAYARDQSAYLSQAQREKVFAEVSTERERARNLRQDTENKERDQGDVSILGSHLNIPYWLQSMGANFRGPAALESSSSAKGLATMIQGGQ